MKMKKLSTLQEEYKAERKVITRQLFILSLIAVNCGLVIGCGIKFSIPFIIVLASVIFVSIIKPVIDRIITIKILRDFEKTLKAALDKKINYTVIDEDDGE